MNTEINNSIIYNVYPTSFYDSNGDGIGDLQGIIEKLEHIKTFADIVWINPVFKSPFRDGGYDVSDYFAIDEKFGTMDDVKRLTEKAHSMGLKVLFDLVVGHTSDQHPWFLEAQKHEKNEYSDYYIFTNEVFASCPYKHISGASERNGNYLINFFSFQPSLNFGFSNKKYDWQHLYTDEPCLKIRDVVVEIIEYYLQLGIDGFRVDMANSIVKSDVEGQCSCEVWRDIFGRVRQKYPKAIFVAEWGQPKFAVKNGDFDIDFITHCYTEGYTNLFRKESGTNVFKGDGDSFFRKEGQGESETFFDYFLSNNQEVKGKGYISVVSGNHDLPRISMGRSQDELKTVFAFILALPCIPLIYYGDEIGMPYTRLKNKDGGYSRTGSRTPMQWTNEKNAGFSTTDGELYLPVNENYTTVNVDAQSKDENSLMNEIAKLVATKRNNPQLFSCQDKFELISSTYPLVFKRHQNGKTLMCAVNPSQRKYTIDTAHKTVLVSHNADIESNKITLKALSYVWLEV